MGYRRITRWLIATVTGLGFSMGELDGEGQTLEDGSTRSQGNFEGYQLGGMGLQNVAPRLGRFILWAKVISSG